MDYRKETSELIATLQFLLIINKYNELQYLAI